MIYLFITIVAVILYFVILKKIEECIKPLNIIIDKLNIQLLSVESKSKREIESMKTNVAINDGYIERLHTKISELEVTLQNLVNKN